MGFFNFAAGGVW